VFESYQAATITSLQPFFLGVLEYWSDGVMGILWNRHVAFLHYATTPLLHSSIVSGMSYKNILTSPSPSRIISGESSIRETTLEGFEGTGPPSIMRSRA
jgi:hypothetical protein